MKDQIEAVLKGFIDPYLGQDWVSARVIKSIDVSSAPVKVIVELGYPLLASVRDALKERASQYLQKHLDQACAVDIQSKLVARAAKEPEKVIEGVKNIIAVASGKGGVGKSTTSVNLALSLQQEGARVGLLDADIYGPNQPQMLGALEKPKNDGKNIFPIMRFGMQVMSMGYLVDAEQPMIWRGPMVSGALEQLLNQTAWDDLDYLILDLPPGTGDVQLTLAQKTPLSAAVIVTTPQEVAVADARKALAMFKKVNVPVLGVIENMSYFTCPHCQKDSYIFAEKGGRRMAEQFSVRLLGEVPMLPEIMQAGESGAPIVIQQPDSEVAQNYSNIARNVAAQLSLLPKSYASKLRVNVES